MIVHIIIMYTDKLPAISELLILKYTNKGEQKKVRIINEARHKWRDIANLISSDANIVSVLQQTYRDDPSECLKQVFTDYFINKKPQGYSHNWNGVLELLDDVELKTLVENVASALNNL